MATQYTNLKKIKNGMRYEKNGWTYLSIKGTAQERGYANGYLMAQELKAAFKMLDHVLYEDYGYPREMFSEIVGMLYGERIQQNYPEFYIELQAIHEGVLAAGVKLLLHDIIFWNCYLSFGYMQEAMPALVLAHPFLKSKYGHIFESDVKSGRHLSREGGGGGHTDKCTGFMAVGSYTKDGKIVCGHNTFDNFVSGQYFNVIIDLQPDKGERILMQAAAGYIASLTDFYVTSSGLMCTETTIGGFNKFELKDPLCCRIRQAMQYSKTLDEVTKALTVNNGGDYANAWLIGDTKTNTIMRIELGLKYVNVEKKTDGYFIGFNGPYDPRIRNLECNNTGFDDIRRHQGARRVRLTQLLEQHKGKLDIEIATTIMGDHYDVYLNKINPSSRTCCSHYELDDRAYMSDPSRPKPFAPRGALDGIVCDSTMTKNMSFLARWGSSCGLPFDVKAYCKKNLLFANQQPYLHERPSQPWTQFFITKNEGAKKTKRKVKVALQTKSRKTQKLKM